MTPERCFICGSKDLFSRSEAQILTQPYVIAVTAYCERCANMIGNYEAELRAKFQGPEEASSHKYDFPTDDRSEKDCLWS